MDTPYQISMHSGKWFMRRRFFKIPQISPTLVQTGPQKMLPTKFGRNQLSGLGEEVI